MRFKEIELSREDWIARRKTPVAISASEIAAVMGVNKHDTPDSVFWQKLGAWSRGSFGGYARFGLDAEEVIHARVQKIYGRHVRLRDPGDSTVQVSVTHPWAQCTVDRFLGLHLGSYVTDWLCPVDFKTGSWTRLPKYVWCQMQWQMFVCEAGSSTVALLRVEDTEVRRDYPEVDARRLEDALHRSEILFFPVERDDEWIVEAVEQGEQFLHNAQQQRQKAA